MGGFIIWLSAFGVIVLWCWYSHRSSPADAWSCLATLCFSQGTWDLVSGLLENWQFAGAGSSDLL